MDNNKRLAGSELDKYIESELLAMVREGIEHAPIKAATLHKRLLLKGYVTGSLSTLSTPKRKQMIRDYQKRQLNQMDMDVNEIATLINGRKANEAYRKQALRMRNERDEMAKKLELNTMAVLDIINAVDLTTPIKVEELLSPFLIRELRKANK